MKLGGGLRVVSSREERKTVELARTKVGCSAVERERPCFSFFYVLFVMLGPPHQDRQAVDSLAQAMDGRCEGPAVASVVVVVGGDGGHDGEGEGQGFRMHCGI